jgi:hypothetical protein
MYAIANSKALLGIKLNAVKNCPMHGKCGADSAGKDPPLLLKKFMGKHI